MSLIRHANAIPTDKMKTLYDEICKLKQDKICLIIQLIEMDELRDENGSFQSDMLCQHFRVIKNGETQIIMY